MPAEGVGSIGRTGVMPFDESCGTLFRAPPSPVCSVSMRKAPIIQSDGFTNSPPEFGSAIRRGPVSFEALTLSPFGAVRPASNVGCITMIPSEGNHGDCRAYTYITAPTSTKGITTSLMFLPTINYQALALHMSVISSSSWAFV